MRFVNLLSPTLLLTYYVWTLERKLAKRLFTDCETYHDIGNKNLEMGIEWKHYLFQQTMTSPIMALKLRIINFLGKLGGAANIGMLENCAFENLSKALAWDKDEHLSFALPFQDMKPTMYLGKKQVYVDCFSLNMGSYVYWDEGWDEWTYPLICKCACYKKSLLFGNFVHILNSWSLWKNTGKKVHMSIMFGTHWLFTVCIFFIFLLFLPLFRFISTESGRVSFKFE